MGIIRKTMSVSSLGLVDFRSDKERTAAYARGTRKHARRTAHNTARQANDAHRMAQAQASQAYTAPVGTPPAWYPDPDIAGQLRYWNGMQWTSATAPMPLR